ncbi:hypothetical protein BBP40_010850 [Aspergillus hancockii]|nr:hypothetical protein BBP40_010850 [Aspergillus hancockii]
MQDIKQNKRAISWPKVTDVYQIVAEANGNEESIPADIKEKWERRNGELLDLEEREKKLEQYQNHILGKVFAASALSNSQDRDYTARNRNGLGPFATLERSYHPPQPVGSNPPSSLIRGQRKHGNILRLGYTEKVFAMPGDSGALLFDIIGDVVGMCFDGDYIGSVTYFTHIHDLIADIKDIKKTSEARFKQDPPD